MLHLQGSRISFFREYKVCQYVVFQHCFLRLQHHSGLVLKKRKRNCFTEKNHATEPIKWTSYLVQYLSKWCDRCMVEKFCAFTCWSETLTALKLHSSAVSLHPEKTVNMKRIMSHSLQINNFIRTSNEHGFHWLIDDTFDEFLWIKRSEWLD